MGKLYTLLAVSVLLAYLYDHSYVETRLGKKKPQIVYIILLTILICFGGFRGAYNDTWTYRDAYVYLINGFPDAWNKISWDLGANPGFIIVESFLKTYDVEVHLFLMFFFFWTTLFYMRFIKRYYTDFALTIYFFFTMGSYLFNMAAIKQCAATAICLMAIPYAIDKKWLRFILLVGIASLFHPYALMYLIVPFMSFRPWSFWTYLLLGGIIFGGFLFQPLLGTVVNITTAIGEEYTVETFSGEGVSILRILAVWSPVVLSFIYRKCLFVDCTREEKIFVNLTMVYAGILFVGLFGTALYFGRLSNYFSMMPVITLPWILTKTKKHFPKDGQLITLTAVICYFVFFYFANTLESQFATSYEALTPLAFLRILLTWLKGVFA